MTANIITLGNTSLKGTAVVYAWCPNVTTTGGASGISGAFTNCQSLIAIRLDSITTLKALSYPSSAQYLVCTTSSMPTLSSGRIPQKVYVRDSLLSSYQANNNWNQRNPTALSELSTDHPECPWLDDLRSKGLIS